jgi:hypothetical protein
MISKHLESTFLSVLERFHIILETKQFQTFSLLNKINDKKLQTQITHKILNHIRLFFQKRKKKKLLYKKCLSNETTEY